MNDKCANCNGDGIVGNGPVPAAKEGHLHTCEVCGGTGKIISNQTNMNEETSAPQEGEEKKDEQVESAPEVGETVPAELEVVPSE